MELTRKEVASNTQAPEGDTQAASPLAPVIPRSGSVPSPDEIAAVAAEIRSEWSIGHRWRSRASDLAILTDARDGFIWPSTWNDVPADDDDDDWEGEPSDD